MPRSLPLAFVLCLATGACQPAPPPSRSTPKSSTDPARATRLIHQAEDATKGGAFDEARRLLDQAEAFADVPRRSEIDGQREAVDAAEAEMLGESITKTIKKASCEEAFEAARAVVVKGGGVAKVLHRQVGKPLEKCLAKELDELGALRGLVAAPGAKAVLGSKPFGALEEKIAAAVAAELEARVAPKVAERDFPGAAAELDALVKAGVLTAKEREGEQEKLREGVIAAIDATLKAAEPEKEPADPKALRGTKAMREKEEARRFADSLGRLDALLVAGWPDRESMPAEVSSKRHGLALHAACRALHCEVAAPRRRWVYGAPIVAPADAPKAPPGTESEQLASGVQVWQLAVGGGFALVASVEPGELEGWSARAAAALGWIAEKDLRDEDTSEMLPPGDAIVGSRVWGPLREGAKDYELGTVRATDGKTCKVRRLSDRVEVEVPRATLRFGVTKAGTKVMGFCSKPDALEPAIVDSVKDVQSEQLDPQVTLSCLDSEGHVRGMLKTGILGSLRMPVEWLPAAR